MKFKKIGFITKPHAKNALKILNFLTDVFVKKKCSVYYDTEAASLLNCPSKGIPRDKISTFIDLLIVLGGDGTLLSAARYVQHNCIPILGINLGSLGFLTDITIAELEKVIDCLDSESFVISSRLTLKTTVSRNNKIIDNFTVLNDAVINKSALARIINLQVTVNKLSLGTFKADGIIVSTPTGSTAYSLAAGGPILYPTINAMIISPICPHMLSNRPIVISDNDIIEITLFTDEEDVVLTLDGQVGIPLKYKDVIKIEKSDSRVDLIELPNSNFFNILKKKLNWGPQKYD